MLVGSQYAKAGVDAAKAVQIEIIRRHFIMRFLSRRNNNPTPMKKPWKP